MLSSAIHPLGPLFGPDFITLQINSESGIPFALEIYPDAANPQLRQQGLPIQFYYMPKQVYLAKRPDSATDFDISVTLFKGLLTAEDSLIPGGAPSVNGEIDAGGAFISFSTTMAVPESVVAGALEKLKAQDHPAPAARIAAHFFRDAGGPAPLLGIVPIVDNNVTIEIPQLPGIGDNKSPWFIDAQGKGQGSIEASGISTFLVSCNQLAAGAIVGALKDGRSPFTVHYNMKMLFYIDACDIQMHVDVDKTFEQFSGALQANCMGFYQADLQANYQSCVTSGAITTIIRQDGVDVDADMKQVIQKQVSDMQDKAWNLVKSEIFDWQPKPDDPAKASTGACGGAAVTLKANYQKHGVVFDDHFEIQETISKADTVSGTLTELEPAIKANLDKYLSIVDIGEYFKKVQVVASPNIDFGDAVTADPINEALVQVSFLDFDQPIDTGGQIKLDPVVEGFHYVPGKMDAAAPVTLGRWSRDNPNDLINFSRLRLDQPSPAGWDKDQVRVTKTLVYRPDDPRVDLSTGTPKFVTVTDTKDHNPVIGPEEVGYVYIKFFLDRPIKASNITVTLTVQMGGRNDVIVLTNEDPKANPTGLWQIWSDKYFNETVARVRIDVEVAPPPSDFAGKAVTWSGNQAIPLNLGRIKRIVPCKIMVPDLADPEQSALVGKYILQTLKETAAP